MTAAARFQPSRGLFSVRGPYPYILALAASFPCLAHKVESFAWPRFDVDTWMRAAGPWSSGEKYAAAFIACVWNPGYAESKGWRFDVLEAFGTWDTGNRRAFLNWAADPIWP